MPSTFCQGKDNSLKAGTEGASLKSTTSLKVRIIVAEGNALGEGLKGPTKDCRMAFGLPRVCSAQAPEMRKRATFQSMRHWDSGRRFFMAA
jgi:hypothetical protein